MISIGEALRRIDGINRTVYRLREGYLRHHPDAPPTEYEQRRDHLRSLYCRLKEHGSDYRASEAEG